MGAALAIARPKPNLANVILAWGVQMTQSFEQHLSQISVDFLSRMEEIQKLRVAILSAETAARSGSVQIQKSSRPAERELRA